MRHIKIIFLFSFNYDNIVLRNVLMINGVHRINFITQNHSQINFLHVQNFYWRHKYLYEDILSIQSIYLERDILVRNCNDIMFHMFETGQYSAFISLGKSLFHILHGTWYAAMSSLKITKHSFMVLQYRIIKIRIYKNYAD